VKPPTLTVTGPVPGAEVLPLPPPTLMLPAPPLPGLTLPDEPVWPDPVLPGAEGVFGTEEPAPPPDPEPQPARPRAAAAAMVTIALPVLRIPVTDPMVSMAVPARSGALSPVAIFAPPAARGNAARRATLDRCLMCRFPSLIRSER